MNTQNDDRPGGELSGLEFAVAGMTCGSCAVRVERALGRQPGVERAAVNFATERASVAFDPARTRVEDLVAAVGTLGYGLAPAASSPVTIADIPDTEARLQALWRRQVIVAWLLGLAVVVLSFLWMDDPGGPLSGWRHPCSSGRGGRSCTKPPCGLVP